MNIPDLGVVSLSSFRGARRLALSAVFNGLLFNITWFAIVSSHSTTLALPLVALHLLIHFRLMGRGLVEVRLIVAVTLAGALIDQILFFTGVLTDAGRLVAAPLWLTAIWPVLATTFMHAFSGLQHRIVLAALLGAVGGAGSYVAGTNLSNVSFGDPTLGPVIMALLWALLFPALLFLARLNQQPGEGNYD